MTMGRSSFGKRDRERAKKVKADAKRERRLTGGDEPVDDSIGDTTATEQEAVPTEVLLKEIEEVHQQREAGEISDDDFQTIKADLLARLPVD
jgi:hypothetical protein